ncbi:MAG: hypothetical protein ACRDD1_07620 [Planctomycetia bacterium]
MSVRPPPVSYTASGWLVGAAVAALAVSWSTAVLADWSAAVRPPLVVAQAGPPAIENADPVTLLRLVADGGALAVVVVLVVLFHRNQEKLLEHCRLDSAQQRETLEHLADTTRVELRDVACVVRLLTDRLAAAEYAASHRHPPADGVVDRPETHNRRKVEA